jgi:hypothetical protein
VVLDGEQGGPADGADSVRLEQGHGLRDPFWLLCANLGTRILILVVVVVLARRRGHLQNLCAKFKMRKQNYKNCWKNKIIFSIVGDY